MCLITSETLSGDKTIFKPFHIEVVDFLKSQLVTGHVSLLSVALYNMYILDFVKPESELERSMDEIWRSRLQMLFNK